MYGANPDPCREGEAPNWEPDEDYDGFGNLIESGEEERKGWRQQAERNVSQLTGC